MKKTLNEDSSFLINDKRAKYSQQLRTKTLKIALPTFLLALVFSFIFLCQLDASLNSLKDLPQSDYSHQNKIVEIISWAYESIAATSFFISPVAFTFTGLLALGMIGVCDWSLFVGIWGLYFQDNKSL